MTTQDRQNLAALAMASHYQQGRYRLALRRLVDLWAATPDRDQATRDFLQTCYMMLVSALRRESASKASVSFVAPWSRTGA
jgi:hypothetical protein